MRMKKNVGTPTTAFVSGPYLMAVRSSPINGRGLFAKAALPARRKLGELSGRMVKLPQAWRDAEGNAKIYLVQVADHWALDCSEGNAFRLVNHSCDANCYLRVFNRRVEVYTRRPIAAGQELTVDYVETPHRKGMQCRCGAANCRGVL
jgi:SET domain-containing protein